MIVDVNDGVVSKANNERRPGIESRAADSQLQNHNENDSL